MQSVLSLANELGQVTRPYMAQIEKPFIQYSAPFYNYVKAVDEMTGLGEGVVIYMTCLFVSYPLALIQRRIPRGSLRHLYSLIFGLLFSFLCFGWMAIHSLIPAVVSYISLCILPASIASKFTFLFAFSYLSVCHVYRMAVDYLGWSLDFSSLQMLATLKIISVAFNVYDGRKKKSEVIPIWEKNSINRVPNPLEYFSFLTFYPCVLTGPVYELQDYLHWIDTPSSKLPWSTKQIFKMVGSSTGCIVLYIVLGPIYNRSKLLSPYIYEISFLQNVINALLIGLVMRQKYYVAWYLAEGACVTAGFGKYAGTENHPKVDSWTQIEHADFAGVELATNLRGVMTNWNKAVSRWLRYYVYTRIGPIEAHVPGGKKRPGLINVLATFTISAFWHGFYPGYYFMWFVMAIAQNAATGMHKKTRPLFIDDAHPEKNSKITVFIYQFLGWLLTSLCISYYTTSFHLLTIADSFEWFSRVHWAGHIVTFGLFFLVKFMPSGSRRAPTTASRPKAE